MKKIFVFILSVLTLPTYGDLITSDVNGGCETDVLGFMDNVFINAKFEPVSITCGTGQYLPANSTICVNCPNEATCTPGTYYFKETKNQGIVYNSAFQENKPSGCVSNLLGIGTIEGSVTIVAKFTPNTINLNWYLDENATTPMNVPTASQQCTYDTKIVLPPEPVRPGYIFYGWRLRKNN